jgi:hypothetical protein
LSNHRCLECERFFVNTKGLASHRAAHHGIVGNSPRSIRRRNKGVKPRSKPPLVVTPGEVYGELTVMSDCNVANPALKTKYQSKVRSHAWVKCICGTEKIVSKFQLIGGYTISCGCYRKGKKDGSVWRALFTVLKHGAEKRNLPVMLTPIHIQILGRMNCFFCDREPANRKAVNSQLYNGIDRVDNDAGYVFNNVLPCCYFCNRAKRNHSLEFFIEQLQRYGSTLTVEDARKMCVVIEQKLIAATNAEKLQSAV